MASSSAMEASRPEPTAQGDLAKTPFAHVLLYCFQHGLNGTLVVWEPPGAEERPGQDRIRMVEGQPVAGRLAQRASRLERGLLPLFARAEGPYAFYSDVDLVGEGEGVREGEVDVLALLTASLRGSCRDEVVDHVLGRFGGARLRLRVGVDLERFGLLPEERTFLDLLRAEPSSVSTLAGLSSLPPRMAERLLYLLAVTRSIEPWEGPDHRASDLDHDPDHAGPSMPSMPAPPSMPSMPAPPSMPSMPAPPSMPSMPAPPEPSRASRPSRRPKAGPELPVRPADLSPEDTALFDELLTRLEVMDGQNYFEMLDVSRSASAADVQQAYFALVKRWHPDRTPASLADARSAMERVFSWLTRAYETLSDEEQRGAYVKSVQEGGGTPEAERKVGAVIQAAMDFRKVDILLKRRAYDEALTLVDTLIERVDDEPDFYAARAFIILSMTTEDARLLEVIESLRRATAIAPNHDRAHYYRGLAMRRAGKEEEAIAAFRQAAEHNPKNIDAVREVRLADMRSRRATGGEGEGLLSKLFGKKR